MTGRLRWERLPHAPELAAALASLVIGAVLLSGQTLVLAGVIGAPLVVVAFLRPLVALAGMMVFVPLEGFASLVPGAFTLPRLIGVVAFACFVGNRFMRREAVLFTPSARVFAAFVAWIFLSGFWATDRTAAYTMVFVVFQLWLFYVMTGNLVVDRATLRLVLLAYVIGCVVASVWAMRNYADQAYATNLQRVSAVDDMNPNDFARLVGFGLLAGVYILFDSASRWVRQLVLVALPVLFVGLALSKGRGAWLAFTVALLVMFALVRKTPRVYTAAGLVVLVLGGTVVAGIRAGYFDDNFSKRFEDTASGKDPTAQRADIWKVGLALFRDNPVAGVGFDNFHVRFNDYLSSVHTDVFPGFNKDPHNVFLSVAGETGIVGFAIFMAFIGILVRAIVRAPPSWGRAVAAGFVVFTLVSAFSGTDHIRKWFWTALLAALTLVTRDFDADLDRQPDVPAA